MKNQTKHNKVIEQLAYDTKFVAKESLDAFLELQAETKPSRLQHKEKDDKRKQRH